MLLLDGDNISWTGYWAFFIMIIFLRRCFGSNDTYQEAEKYPVLESKKAIIPKSDYYQLHQIGITDRFQFFYFDIAEIPETPFGDKQCHLLLLTKPRVQLNNDKTVRVDEVACRITAQQFLEDRACYMSCN